MKTKEKNKMIAEFMNIKTWHNSDLTDDPNVPNEEIGITTRLSFHKSWDWLVPVVNKILMLEYKTNDESLLRLIYSMRYYSFPDIKIVYNNAVEFIERYNELRS